VSSCFSEFEPVPYRGPQSTDPLSFRWYEPERLVLGKPMHEHLRLSVCYWHTFVWLGQDPFGGQTFEREWFETPGCDPMRQARLKAEAAFDLFTRLGVPFFCFHDRDIAPEGSTPRESQDNLQAMGEVLQGHMDRTGVRLLWGTANLFSHRRYMAGAATNPDPEIFAIAATQVAQALELTHAMGGENYVLWGGREGYETLLNTDVRQELDQMGRFLSMVVEHKHRIGFRGTILLEPKPREPSAHQYDFDVQTVHAFLQRYGLDKEVKVNIEANHATLAGHKFEHEVAMAAAAGILGCIDMNRGDPQLGWDTDQFPNNVPELTVAMLHILRAGGLGTGGMNFDAKVRRQSLDPEDVLVGHIGAMDVCARALLAAEAILQDGWLERFIEKRYAGWQGELGRGILDGGMDVAALSRRVLDRNTDVQPVSGKQELLENYINRFV
jgi:xylose isomerase